MNTKWLLSVLLLLACWDAQAQVSFNGGVSYGPPWTGGNGSTGQVLTSNGTSPPSFQAGGGGGSINPATYVQWQNGIGSQFVTGASGLKNWIQYTDGGGGQIAYHLAGADDSGVAGNDAINITRDTNPGDCGVNTLIASMICSITLETQTIQNQLNSNLSNWGCDANDDCLLRLSNNSGGNKGFSHLALGALSSASVALVTVPTAATSRATSSRPSECETVAVITPPYQCVWSNDKLIVSVAGFIIAQFNPRTSVSTVGNNSSSGGGVNILCTFDTNCQVNSRPIADGLSLPRGTATFAVGTNVTSVGCASGFTCNNKRGTLTIVGGTATTGTIATVTFSASLVTAPACFASQNGGATYFGIGNGAPSATAFTITAGVTVNGQTLNVNYQCGS